MGIVLSSVVVLASIAILVGIVLGISSEVFKVEVDPKIEKLIEALPGLNCGACGFPGCSGYAKSVFEGKATLNKCTPGGPDVSDKLKKIVEE